MRRFHTVSTHCAMSVPNAIACVSEIMDFYMQLQRTCCAVIRSPVSTISMASDFPTARGSLWVPPRRMRMERMGILVATQIEISLLHDPASTAAESQKCITVHPRE